MLALKSSYVGCIDRARSAVKETVTQVWLLHPILACLHSSITGTVDRELEASSQTLVVVMANFIWLHCSSRKCRKINCMDVIPVHKYAVGTESTVESMLHGLLIKKAE